MVLFDLLVLLFAAVFVSLEPSFGAIAGACCVIAFFVLGSLWLATTRIELSAHGLTRRSLTGIKGVDYRDIAYSTVRWKNGRPSLLSITRQGGTTLALAIWTLSTEDQEDMLALAELRIDRS
jgi:hypothetical protein